MWYECEGKCDEKICVFCLSLAVERAIFYKIKVAERWMEGEIEEEDWFNEMVNNFWEETMNDYLMDSDNEKLIYHYGINRAFREFARDMGGRISVYDNDKIAVYDNDKEICKKMIDHFVEYKMELSYENYKGWCKRNE
jgi:hypothetical protein